MSNIINANQQRYGKSPDAWQTKVQQLIKLPFPLPWIFIAGVLFMIGYAIVYFLNESSEALRLLAIQSVLIAAIANSVVFFEQLLDAVADTFPSLLDEPETKAQQWVKRWYQSIFWSKINLLTGLILASICVLFGANGSAAIYISSVGKVYSYFISFIIGFLGGSMFWTMLGIARLTSSLGRDVNIKPSIFDSKTSVLRTASSVLWKVSLTASLVYLLGVSIYFFCSLQIEATFLGIVLVFGTFIILYFILPQLNIHKTLVTIKRTRLKALVQRIDDTFDNVASKPTVDNINQLRDLFHLQDIVNGRRTWSFGIGELTMLIGSVLIPLLLFVIEHFLSK